MRVIRTEFSSLHLCSLTFSRPLEDFVLVCLRPVLDERLTTSITGPQIINKVPDFGELSFGSDFHLFKDISF